MKASPEPEDLAERLQRLIAQGGPISVAHYMAEANAHYYASRDPLGDTDVTRWKDLPIGATRRT